MADPKDTKEKILDSAEELFTERGFGATSMRGITSAADVNLAAVHYHFGSKEALIEAVLARRVAPLNAERLARLDIVERSGSVSDERLKRILEAFVGPAIRLSADPVCGDRVMRLVGHALGQPHGPMRDRFTEMFREVFVRFSAALHDALPDLPRGDLAWRFLFTVGAMAHTMALSHDIERMSGGACDPSDVDAVIQRLVEFVSAGMRTPAHEPSAVDPS